MEVHNEGPHPGSLLPHIFEPFRHGGAAPKATPGLGLGLFISQQIVVADGGSMKWSRRTKKARRSRSLAEARLAAIFRSVTGW